MKDQEILLKPGNHKKSFANKNQVKERLLRFHLFYTAEPYKAYRRLQGEDNDHFISIRTRVLNTKL